MVPSRMVIGIEGDISSGGRATTATAYASGTSANENNVFDSESARARLGYAVDNILLYGTAGLAWSNNQYIRTQLTGTFNLATPGTEEAVNKYLTGWTAGGGVAFAFERNWNAFAEYRHTSFGSSTVALPFSQLATTSKTDVSEIDFGVNYKLDWNGPAGSGFTLPTNMRRLASAPLYKAPPASLAYNFTGFYIGGDAGYGWAGSSGTLTTAAEIPIAPYDYGLNGTLAGAFMGADYQFNRFVVGAEGDWQGANLIGNSQVNSSFGIPAGTFPGGPFTISTTIKDYGSIRARLGVAFDRFLLFGTAGWAWGNPSNAYALYGAPPFFTRSGYSFGWTAGAGLEYAFTNNVLGRIEYRYTNLGTSSLVNAAMDSADGGHRVPISDVRTGIAYKFDGSSIFARY
jgi:outer membrane immunogenic protein